MYPSIPQRANLSEQQFVDIFVSIHFNIGSPSVNGTETYYRTNGPAQPPGVHQRSIDYAALLAQIIDSVAVGGGNRGARPSSASPLGRLGVLDDNNRPAALVETSFLSNPSEQERLRSPGYRDIIAQAYEIAITQGNSLRPRFRDQRNPRY
jgi:N-acetylmuramoyl-L-alanine amidase